MKTPYQLTCLLLALATCSLSAQVYVNEFSASNLNSFTDSFDKTEDWIELYNAGSTAVDISGWHLSDKESKPEKWEIPAGTIVPPQGFLVFLCSGRDGVFNDEFHTNFKLSQTSGSDIVLFTDSEGEVLEMYDLDLTLVEHSRCRTVDGGAIWAICTTPSYGTSNTGTEQYLAYTQAPTMSLGAGYYEGPQTVFLTNNEPNSTLHFTTDGTNPTTDSPVYADSIVINETQVVKAQAFSNDPVILPGKMDFRTFFIDEAFSLAVFSVAADQVIELANGNGALIPIGSIEYFNIDQELEAKSFGSLNRHGQDSWVLPHRSLDWISRDEMGYSKAVDAPLFSYSDRDEYQRFMFRNSGDDNYPAINDNAHQGSTHLRDEFVHTLSQEGGMELDVRAVERVILFLNGQYWGVYGMRERPADHDYTEEYYDQDKYNIQYFSTWGNTEIEYGGQQAMDDWTNLRDFILDNDMSIEENYEIAEDSINMLSLIDYMIVNLTVVASDWLNYNTGWWRGLDPEGGHKKWGYILWDLDATFDYYINYSGVPNTNPDAVPCDLEEIADYMDDFFGGNGGGTETPPADCPTILNGSAPYPATDSIFAATILQDGYCCHSGWDDICQDIYDEIFAAGGGPGDVVVDNVDVGKHEKIFLKLLDENPVFRQLYYSRYADMMNTVYTCENMLTTLNRMIAVIQPEMPGQIERWGGSMSEWQENLDDLRNFIDQRCTLLDDGMLDCYEELTGPYTVTLLTEPDSIGEIDFNTLDIEAFPWTGSYFGGMENRIKAKVFDEYEDIFEFSHWVSTAGNIITPDVYTRRADITLSDTDTLIAVFSPLVGTRDLANKIGLHVFPNPTQGDLVLEYELDEGTDMLVELYSPLGERITIFAEAGGRQTSGNYRHQLSLEPLGLSAGLYLLSVSTHEGQATRKVMIMD